MECVSFPPLSRVAVCGGTHGNEWTGVYMVREMLRQGAQRVGAASLTAVLSNPPAVDACRRYVDVDLNRCFTSGLLSCPVSESSPYEMRRAQELNAQLGPKGSLQAVDLLCDLHNTTSNMGLTLIFYSADPLPLHILKYIQAKVTSAPVRAIQVGVSASDAYSLESVGKHGFSIEAGPQPNGVLRADVYNMVKEAWELTLEWIQLFNSGRSFEGGDVEVYRTVRPVDYPRDPANEHITAAIHPQLQDQDFKLLREGDPVFLTFTGETLRHEGDELHPFFINECAYYEKKIAFHLGRKVKVTLPPVRVQQAPSCLIEAD